MNLEILQENLLKHISVASRFINTKSNLPILSNLLLKATEKSFEIFATNLESSIKVSLGAKINEPGEITVSAKTFLEYINSIDPQKLNLSLNEQKLNVIGEHTQAVFVTVNAQEFPKFPALKQEKLITLKKDLLKNIIQKTTLAAASDETRPVLTGVLIKKEETQLSFVATDGFRLSENFYPLQEEKEMPKNFHLIVRAVALNELERLLHETSEEKIDLYFTEEENQIAFRIGSFTLITRLLEAEYPAYKKVIPTEFNLKVLLDTQDFLRAVKVAAIFVGSDTQTIKLKIDSSDKKVVLSGESINVGESETHLPAVIEGEGLEMAFNARFLQEGLASLKSEQIQIQIKEKVAPTLFTSPAEENYKHIIMPIRLDQTKS